MEKNISNSPFQVQSGYKGILPPKKPYLSDTFSQALYQPCIPFVGKCTNFKTPITNGFETYRYHVHPC
ncbi:hypothetical protein BRADI_1g20203v3 [Brachypodium distachyon]|uniref:Uncharacterized protein n=1 Tax=Brachypodium distachyon TaxID=15368 RepID=A0A2K2DK70_BRADI|nr:hypothetical protein BRADI_1g20203v3 [Brachypodium distachyon]